MRHLFPVKSDVIQNSNISDSSEFYKQVIESIEDYALLTTDERLCITSWNKGAQNLFNYLEEDILNRNSEILYASTTAESKISETAAKESLLHGKSSYERYHVRKDGSLFWASSMMFPLRDENKKHIGFTQIIKDYSEKKASEQRLLAAKSFVENQLDNADYPLVILSPDFKINTATPSFYALFGKDKKEMNGKKLGDFWNPSELKELLEDILPHNSACEDIEISGDFLNQGEVTFKINAHKICWYKDYADMILLSLENTTEKPHTIRYKDDFVSIASHELKTPVTVIKLYTQILEKITSTSAYSALQKPVLKIQEQADKLSLLLSTLTDLSHLHAGSLKFNSENFTLSVLIEETLANFKLIEQKHQVVFGNQVNGLVQVDKFRLAQALINIITNAIKYSPSKDTFYLNVYKSGNEKEFLITICDLEMNISPENIDSLFERFSKIEQTIQGAGLDLFMASEIIKQHGGKIGFQSKENHQTEFFFSIPAISAQKTC